MKKLEAVIRPFKLDEVKDALASEGLDGMTISEVRGCGDQPARAQQYRGVEYTVDFLPKIKIEVVVEDAVAPRAAEILRLHARTGQPGDGNLLLTPVDDAIRIRTGERGEHTVGRAPLRVLREVGTHPRTMTS